MQIPIELFMSAMTEPTFDHKMPRPWRELQSTLLFGTTLLIASLIGIPDAFSIVFLGSRFGRVGPLACGIGVAIAGLVILTSTQHPWFYLLGSCCLGFSWAFCLPYIQGLMASLDPNGSAVAAIALFLIAFAGFFVAGHRARESSVECSHGASAI